MQPSARFCVPTVESGKWSLDTFRLLVHSMVGVEMQEGQDAGSRTKSAESSESEKNYVLNGARKWLFPD